MPQKPWQKSVQVTAERLIQNILRARGKAGGKCGPFPSQMFQVQRESRVVLVALAYTACHVVGRRVVRFTWPSLVITTKAVT